MDEFRNNESASELKKKLYKRYGNLLADKLSETELIQKTKHWLANHPASLKKYENALDKYESGVFERNTLDDIRYNPLLSNKRQLAF